ncbi:MAG: hypothetical protein JXB85_06665 [Anaerolineales bacterium]|nr:hypothetical protein [Anaerolineales bacterium]
MDNSLQLGIAAHKAGDHSQAFQLLTRATQDNRTAEQAWLWLSAVVTHDSERLFCLDNVLRINQNNVPAQRGVAMLRQKGVFPSVPMPPTAAQSPAATLPGVEHATSSISAPPAPLQPQTQARPQPPAAAGDQEGLKGLYQYAAQAIASKTPSRVVLKSLTDQGVSSETAARIVSQTEQAFKKGRSEKYRKQMIAGLLWTGAGVAVTVMSSIFRDQLGGSSILCYGAIIFGIIDFLVGLVGWLSHR